MKKEYRSYVKIDRKKLEILHAKGLSDRKIAEELGASQTGISRARQSMGLEPNFEFPGNPEGNPKQFYEDSKERARQWKEENKNQVKKHFDKWQKDHREERTDYMFKWRHQKSINLTQMGRINNKKRG